MQIKTWRYVIRDRQEPAHFFEGGAILNKKDIRWTNNILNAKLLNTHESQLYQGIINENEDLSDLYIDKIDFTIEYDE